MSRTTLAARAFGACVVLAVSGVASTARAEPEEVTVVAGPRAALASRLTKEMQAAGLVVHVEATEPTSDAPSLFIVVPEADGAPIEIWAVKDGKRTLVASVASDGPADTRVLRAAEIARALAATGSGSVASSGANPVDATSTPPNDALPNAVQPTAAQPITGPPNAAPAAAPTAPPTFWQWKSWTREGADRAPPPTPTPPSFDFGLALGLGLQAPGPSMQIEASAHVWPADRFGVGVFVSGAAVGASLDTREGPATLRSSILGIELATAPVSRTGAFSLLLSPGVGLDWIHIDATPFLPTGLPTGGDGVQLALYGRAELRVAVAGPLRLTASAMGGAALPNVDIIVQGTTYSTFAGFGSTSLGAEARAMMHSSSSSLRSAFLIGSPVILGYAMFVGAGCVTQISPFDGGGAGVDVGGSAVGTPGVAVVSSSSGVVDTCGSFEDLGDCTADTTSLDPVDLAGAEHSVVGNWSRCGDTSTGTFDGGIRLQANGRVYRLYRGPNGSGSTEFLLYCGNDQSDGGAWAMGNVPGTTQGEFVLTVTWDDGTTAAYDVEFYEGLSRLGLFEDPETQAPEVFAPAGAAIDF